MELRLWWRYQDVDPGSLRGWSVAVVDAVRATTTVAAALAAGARAVRPVADEEEARALARALGAVLAGERACLPPPGFDLGNSPAAFTPDRVAGREVVLWTTNGSRALAACAAAADALYAFALVNARAVARHLAAQAPARLAVVCAGTEGAFSLEDAFAAGALLERLREAWSGPLAPDEAAVAAALLYRGGRDDPLGTVRAGRAAARLRAAGLEGDLAFVARQDALDVVPRWEAGALRPA